MFWRQGLFLDLGISEKLIPEFIYLGETHHELDYLEGLLQFAENQTVIYPRETPGGWNIIGRMPGSIVSVTRDSIDAKFVMGRLVRFQSISMDEFQAIEVLDDPD